MSVATALHFALPTKEPVVDHEGDHSASVMGLRASSPSSEYRVAGFMGPTIGVRFSEPAASELIYSRDLHCGAMRKGQADSSAKVPRDLSPLPTGGCRSGANALGKPRQRGGRGERVERYRIEGIRGHSGVNNKK